MKTLRVIEPGPLTTVQDLGRPGRAADGVGMSGAADSTSLRLANRLVGNVEGAAGLEMTLGGLSVEAQCLTIAALTGAPAPVRVDGRAESVNSLLVLRPGKRLTVGPPSSGLRTYAAFRGGIDTPVVLGSRSTDLLAGLGPAPLRAGDRLPLGVPEGPYPCIDHAPVPAPAQAGATVRLRFTLGPRHDWFEPDAVQTLTCSIWQVEAQSNRIGVRLSGLPLPRRRQEELPSEGAVLGAIQVPPSGPVLFLADHPLTGGYPVIGVLDAASVARAAQVRPGTCVHFERLHPRTSVPA